jgi:hypothetical protein
MKKLSFIVFFVMVSLVSVVTVHAQSTETLWIHASGTAFKTNETVIVTVNGVSTTPIQGFTAQIRYDPSCLQPENGTSPISGMNGLAFPQQAGVADVSFASTTPQTANGILAELRFKAFKGCQTSLMIESAALVVRSEAGLAVPVSGIHVDQTPLMLNIDNTQGNPQPEVAGPSALPLTPANAPASFSINWRMIGLLVLATILIAFTVGLFVVLKPSTQ